MKSFGLVVGMTLGSGATAPETPWSSPQGGAMNERLIAVPNSEIVLALWDESRADDETVEGAVSNLLETVEAALDGASKYNADAFGDAPQKYWDMMASAQELPRELLERIIFNANRRHTPQSEPIIDVEDNCDIRQLVPA